MLKKIKLKIPQIILGLSLAPCVLLLLYAIFSIIFGANWFGGKIYGLEAYCLVIAIIFLLFFYIFVPCFLYQIVYAIAWLKKRRKESIAEPPLINKILFKSVIFLYITGYLFAAILYAFGFIGHL